MNPHVHHTEALFIKVIKSTLNEKENVLKLFH